MLDDNYKKKIILYHLSTTAIGYIRLEMGWVLIPFENQPKVSIFLGGPTKK